MVRYYPWLALSNVLDAIKTSKTITQAREKLQQQYPTKSITHRNLYNYLRAHGISARFKDKSNVIARNPDGLSQMLKVRCTERRLAENGPAAIADYTLHYIQLLHSECENGKGIEHLTRKIRIAAKNVNLILYYTDMAIVCQSTEFSHPDCFGTFEGRYQRVPSLNLIAAPVPASWSHAQIVEFNRNFIIDDDDECMPPLQKAPAPTSLFEWSTASERTLIDSIRRFDVIWNDRISGHFDPDQVGHAWQQVAIAVHCSVDECQMKWEMLKGAYEYARREITASNQWFSIAKSESNMDEGGDDDDDDGSMDNTSTLAPAIRVSSTPNGDHISLVEENSSSMASMRRMFGTKTAHKSQPLIDAGTQASTSAFAEKPVVDTDRFTIFGESVASTLRSIPIRSAIALMSRIRQLQSDAETESLSS